MRFFFGLLLPFLLAACTPTVVRQGEGGAGTGNFSIEARISVSTESERFSGRLSWMHSSTRDALRLVSPFGQVVAEIDSQPGLARLISSDRRHFEAGSVEQLTRDVLGYALPVDQLAGWVRGLPGTAARVERDARGRVVSLDEDGWSIAYDYEDGDLPVRLTVVRPGGPELRLRIEEWHLD